VSDANDNPDFSDAFCDFLKQSVPTVNAAELLLLLLQNAGPGLRAAELAARIEPLASLTESEVAKHLELFEQCGLVARLDDGSVRYQPGSPGLEEHVRTLARLYNERPVTLIRVIYALRDQKIKTFADAFRIRGE
jgi:hypothetical protein